MDGVVLVVSDTSTRFFDEVHLRTTIHRPFSYISSSLTEPADIESLANQIHSLLDAVKPSTLVDIILLISDIIAPNHPKAIPLYGALKRAAELSSQFLLTVGAVNSSVSSLAAGRTWASLFNARGVFSADPETVVRSVFDGISRAMDEGISMKSLRLLRICLLTDIIPSMFSGKAYQVGCEAHESHKPTASLLRALGSQQSGAVALIVQARVADASSREHLSWEESILRRSDTDTLTVNHDVTSPGEVFVLTSSGSDTSQSELETPFGYQVVALCCHSVMNLGAILCGGCEFKSKEELFTSTVSLPTFESLSTAIDQIRDGAVKALPKKEISLADRAEMMAQFPSIDDIDAESEIDFLRTVNEAELLKRPSVTQFSVPMPRSMSTKVADLPQPVPTPSMVLAAFAQFNPLNSSPMNSPVRIRSSPAKPTFFDYTAMSGGPVVSQLLSPGTALSRLWPAEKRRRQQQDATNFKRYKQSRELQAQELLTRTECSMPPILAFTPVVPKAIPGIEYAPDDPLSYEMDEMLKKMISIKMDRISLFHDIPITPIAKRNPLSAPKDMKTMLTQQSEKLSRPPPRKRPAEVLMPASEKRVKSDVELENLKLLKQEVIEVLKENGVTKEVDLMGFEACYKQLFKICKVLLNSELDMKVLDRSTIKLQATRSSQSVLRNNFSITRLLEFSCRQDLTTSNPSAPTLSAPRIPRFPMPSFLSARPLLLDPERNTGPTGVSTFFSQFGSAPPAGPDADPTAVADDQAGGLPMS